MTTKSLNGTSSQRIFLDGSKRSFVTLHSVAIGRGTYLPGWKWSEHAGKQTGKESAAHIGYVISGEMVIRDANGKEERVGPGTAFEVGPGHNAWVVGDEPCVAIDFENLK